MSYRNSNSISNRAAVSPGGGCLSGYLLPPLAVLCVGAVLLFVSLGFTNPPVQAKIPAIQTEVIQTNGARMLLSPIFTPEVQYWADKIPAWAAAAGLDPNLIATIMQIESCGDPQARSRSGAMGLFQVMPYHFTPTDNPYDPNTNALRGLDYLRRSLETANGDPRLALAGYNGGIGVINLPESNWTEQTQKYAYWGSGIYAEATNGGNENARLQEWLNANGISLCKQAHDRLGIIP